VEENYLSTNCLFLQTRYAQHKNEYDMTRTMKPPKVSSYFQALQRMFQMQSEILTGVIPHAGERGRNDEERFRDFLTKVIPKRFSIGTGFLVCSETNVPASSQIDVVLYDEIYNSPLHRELSAFVYPIEIVYGIVEVKGLLKKDDLKKVMEDIHKVRKLSQHRWYVQYTSKPKSQDKPDQLVVNKKEFQISGPPPRAFVFAYEKKGWRDLDSLVQSLEEIAHDIPAHIHGLVVLSKDWYVTQEAYAKDGQKFHAYEGNALLRFVNGMVHSIASIPMFQMSHDRYLKF